MERIKNIWQQLEDNPNAIPGFYRIRYSKNKQPDLYLGIKYPEAQRMLIIKTPYGEGKDFNYKFEFKGLIFHKMYDPDDNKYLLLNLVLNDNQLKDIFDTLVFDIISSIEKYEDIQIILKTFANRLSKWQSLFERLHQQGLTPEEQRGLFGELYFMRKYLLKNENHLQIVTSWLGPQKQTKDYQYKDWAVEVKTTHGNNHQKIHISSERQLDTKNIKNLLLYHISLEIRQQSGESLNDLVDSITELLTKDYHLLDQFKIKLHEAGYFVQHKEHYNNIGYFIRNDHFYSVVKDFPRIEEKDIRNGVGDVKYTIITSNYQEYLISEDQAFQILK